MKRVFFGLGFAAGLLLNALTSENAYATSVELTPSFEVVRVGDSLEVAVSIDGLGNMSSPIAIYLRFRDCF